MKKYQNILIAGAMGAVAALALPVQAQSGHDHHAATPAVKVAQAGEMAEGEVRKIDKENKKITLKHGPLKSLDMPPMTMVFRVPDASLLDKDWFNAKQYPEAKFESQKIEKTADGYVANGNLTLKGTTKPATGKRRYQAD